MSENKIDPPVLHNFSNPEHFIFVADPREHGDSCSHILDVDPATGTARRFYLPLGLDLIDLYFENDGSITLISSNDRK